ncbi:glycosyltransferase family A protein [Alkalibacter mobilis]|uniref:glycosyltransferase family A protein n=1 Tax=Alkalibacter mobilis TaxID=2787712 RepID=UPI00189EF364|nr:glycosyltransferase family A protein [Alkalibacter mobilis]MBF7097336.1 glycosyltransferase family 2 protein [Alkalibacter mobilis]
MRVEVLCVTMHQKGLEKYNNMNIKTDAVFANQAERYDYMEQIIDGNSVKMVTTPYRGVGNNRNMGILHSSGDILMFADDDMVYADGYSEGVIKAFKEHPDCDMMVFSYITDSKRKVAAIEKVKRVRLWNFMRYGTVSFVIKRESLLKYNLIFTQLFGGGSRYCAGEDNLFLRDALKRGLKVYSHPFVIAYVNKDDSTWFKGYDERYFFDNGAWLETAFPILKHLLVWYFVFKFSKRSKIGKIEILKLQYAGIKSFHKGISYHEWHDQITKGEK